MKERDHGPRCDEGKVRGLRPLGAEMAVSGALSGSDIEAAFADGFRTIIDLRNAGSRAAGLTPDAERRLAELAGMDYERIAIDNGPLDGSRINELRVALWAAEPKILLHCGDGRIATLCGMIHLGCQSGWTIEQCLDFALEHHIDFGKMPRVRKYLEDYIQCNSRAYIGAPGNLAPQPLCRP